MRDQLDFFYLGCHSVYAVQLKVTLDEGFYGEVARQHLLDLGTDQE